MSGIEYFRAKVVILVGTICNNDVSFSRVRPESYSKLITLVADLPRCFVLGRDGHPFTGLRFRPHPTGFSVGVKLVSDVSLVSPVSGSVNSSA